jgi:hypothetical protein
VISRFEFRKFNPVFGAGAKLRPVNQGKRID